MVIGSATVENVKKGAETQPEAGASVLQIRSGYTGMSYTVKVKSDAPAEQLEELRQLAHKFSPMIETVVNGVPIEGAVAKE